MGIKGSSINSGSPYAERLTTLSEIDSAWSNGELSLDDARKRALEVTGGNIDVIKAMFEKKEVKCPRCKTAIEYRNRMGLVVCRCGLCLSHE